MISSMVKDDFLDYIKLERNYSDKTVVSYETDLREFECYLVTLDDGIRLENADSDIVRNWIIGLMDKGMAQSSVNRKISALRTFYKYLLKKNIITKNPMSLVNGPKRKKPLPVFVRQADMDRLLDDIPFEDSFKGVRERLIIEVFYETGIRLSELISMKDSDVDIQKKILKVTGKGNKQRYIPFGEELKNAMLAYLKFRDETVNAPCEAFFVRENGKGLYQKMVYKIVKHNLSKVVTLKKRSPHVLRHSFATAMLNNDAELEAVKELLGHESVTTTEIYTHTSFEELKKVYKQAHPRA